MKINLTILKEALIVMNYSFCLIMFVNYIFKPIEFAESFHMYSLFIAFPNLLLFALRVKEWNDEYKEWEEE